MNALIPYLLVGGALHGNWVAAPGEIGKTIIIPMTFPIRAVEYSKDPRLDDMSIEVLLYKITQLRNRTILLYEGK